MRVTATFAVLLALLASAACEDDRPAPTAPEAPVPTATPTIEEAPVLSADAAPCPCWSSRSLASAFPVASFFFEDLVAEDAAGRAVLQAGDVANVRVLQALVEFVPRPAAAGDNWCQMATFGQSGLERESISSLKITAEEFESCVLLLQHHADVLGLEARTD